MVVNVACVASVLQCMAVVGDARQTVIRYERVMCPPPRDIGMTVQRHVSLGCVLSITTVHTKVA